MRLCQTIISLSAVLLLISCASPSVNSLTAPDGTTLKNVKCNIDPQKCFAVATESCKESGGTYRVISSHSNAGGTLADIIPGPVTWYNMTYACGPSDGRMPDFAFKGQTYSPAPTIEVNQNRPRATTTNCTTIGNSVSCTSY